MRCHVAYVLRECASAKRIRKISVSIYAPFCNKNHSKVLWVRAFLKADVVYNKINAEGAKAKFSVAT